VSFNNTCPPPSDNCSTSICYDYIGCGVAPVVCNVNSSSTNCDTAACDPTSGLCVVTQHACVLAAGVIVAVALSTAAVVGIAIAIVACLGISSAATYAAYNKFSDDTDVSIVNNPLYVGTNLGGANPLAVNN